MAIRVAQTSEPTLLYLLARRFLSKTGTLMRVPQDCNRTASVLAIELSCVRQGLTGQDSRLATSVFLQGAQEIWLSSLGLAGQHQSYPRDAHGL